ncbi:MAG: CDP-alcohol phosphatidyltransferase family protein [Thermoleophilia bacterium]
MFDAAFRRHAGAALAGTAGRLARAGVRPLHVTGLGLVVGVGACVLAGLELWPAALALLLVNRALDALDGVLARQVGPTDLGGLADLLADLVVYAGFVVAVGVAVPDARLAAAALLATYYLNVGLWLSLAQVAARRGVELGDDRSLRFVRGLAEATETTVAYGLICLLPGHAATIAWAFAGVVAATVAQRVVLALRLLRGPRAHEG